MNLVAPAVVSRYGKGTDSDATDAMVVGSLQAANAGRGWRMGADEAGAGQLVTHSLTSEGHDASEDGTGRGTPLAVSENQRAELRETPYVRQITNGGGKPGQGYPAIREGAAVRRLSPVECERLQSLPDGWTLEYGPSLADEPNFPHRTDESCPPPDSRRYAACGDAVTSNVAEFIGRRLKECG